MDRLRRIEQMWFRQATSSLHSVCQGELIRLFNIDLDFDGIERFACLGDPREY